MSSINRTKMTDLLKTLVYCESEITKRFGERSSRLYKQQAKAFKDIYKLTFGTDPTEAEWILVLNLYPPPNKN